MSSADGRPHRRGPIALILAWLAVLAGGAGIAAYALITGPDTRPLDDRPKLSMSLPAPPTPQRAEAPASETSGPETAGPEPAMPETAAPEDTATAGSGDPQSEDGTTAADPPAAPQDAGPSGAGPAQTAPPQSESAQAEPSKAAGASAPDVSAQTGQDGIGQDGTADRQPSAGADAAGRPSGGVAVNIPQPPTQGQARPTDLLGGTAEGDDAGGDDAGGTGGSTPQTRDTAQQTASRGDAEEPASGARTDKYASLPQLPVSDPDAPAWKRYAQRMTPPQGVPKIAIIVRGLGLSSAAAETAVNQLPASVSLAFTPYARDRAKAWAAEARRNGHEVLVDLPMEPSDYPATDPGPQAIMTEISTRENLQRLDWLLAQIDREVGVVAQMGSAVLTDRQVAEPVLRAIKDRGLMFVDNGVVADSAARDIARRLGLPFAVNDRTLDGGQVSRRAIEARLVEAERLAREQGLAVVMAHPYPVSLELLVGWTNQLEARGFVLVPATYAAIERTGQNAAQLR